jgi:tRNA-specific 2-thiouridylase
MVDAGYDVTGIMLKLWRGEAANTGSGCCNVDAASDARRVADALGIRFYVLNFAERFEETVVHDFRETYAAGSTPNPCVRCNQWIKFDALLDRARALGSEVLATGHYARVRRSDGRYRLLRGADAAKDQSYVLWMLTQDHLAHTRFPVGEMSKTETRRVAAELGLRTAAKPDSQEICFVRDGDLGAYVSQSIPQANEEGPIIDSSGRVLGRHAGIGRYTVGQRRGLGISLGAPVFVSAIDAAENTLVVGPREELAVAAFETRETSATGAPLAPGPVLVQHRAHGDAAPGMVEAAGGGRARVRFETPVEAVAPGQSAAFYSMDDPDELLGGGIVAATVAAAPAPV